jgi:hypothetical protein
MIEASIDFTAPPSVSPVSAKATPAALRKGDSERASFAQFLADSGTQVDSKNELAKLPLVADIFDRTEDSDVITDPVRADGAIAVDIAAMFALVVTETPQSAAMPILPAGGTPVADFTRVDFPVVPVESVPLANLTTAAAPSTASVVGKPFEDLARTETPPASVVSTSVPPNRTAKRGFAVPSAPAGPAKGPVAPIEVPEGLAAPNPAVVETKVNRDLASNGDQRAEPLKENRSNPLIAQMKSPEFPSGSVTKKFDEPQPRATLEVDVASSDNRALGIATQPGAINSLSFAASTPTLLVPAHTQSPAWSKDFGQHVVRLAVEGQPTAEIHLNPPDWGPIRVSIEIKGNDATLQFIATHPQTRDALTDALPRLRELFGAHNLNIVDANISSDTTLTALSQHFSGSPGQRFAQPQPTPSDGRQIRELGIEDPTPAPIKVARSAAANSRVDLFA